MEVVLLEQFGLAEPQHVGVDAPLDQGGVQAVGPLKGLVDGRGGVGPADLAVFAEGVAAECQDRSSAGPAESGRRLARRRTGPGPSPA